PQAVHVLVWGITPEQHEWLQANRHDVEVIAEHLRENAIACALAHPFYAVEAPLAPRHRRRLAELFDVWEVRNGSRAPELHGPAPAPDPRAVLRMVERVLSEGDARRGGHDPDAAGARSGMRGWSGADLRPEDARALLRAWLSAVDLGELGEEGLLALLQDDAFAHADLFRRARRAHERKLTAAVRASVGGLEAGESPLTVAAGL